MPRVKYWIQRGIQNGVDYDLDIEIGAGSRILGIYADEGGGTLSLFPNHSGSDSNEAIVEANSGRNSFEFAKPGLPVTLDVNRDGSTEHVNITARVILTQATHSVVLVYDEDPDPLP